MEDGTGSIGTDTEGSGAMEFGAGPLAVSGKPGTEGGKDEATHGTAAEENEVEQGVVGLGVRGRIQAAAIARTVGDDEGGMEGTRKGLGVDLDADEGRTPSACGAKARNEVGEFADAPAACSCDFGDDGAIKPDADHDGEEGVVEEAEVDGGDPGLAERVEDAIGAGRHGELAGEEVFGSKGGVVDRGL